MKVVVVEGDNIQGYLSENCNMLKLYNISSSLEENLIIHGLWKDMSKIDGSIDIITFITSLNIEKHL